VLLAIAPVEKAAEALHRVLCGLTRTIDDSRGTAARRSCHRGATRARPRDEPGRGAGSDGLEPHWIVDVQTAHPECAAEQTDPHPADIRLDAERLGATLFDRRTRNCIKIAVKTRKTGGDER
jgi:hypothetical protein